MTDETAEPQPEIPGTPVPPPAAAQPPPPAYPPAPPAPVYPPAAAYPQAAYPPPAPGAYPPPIPGGYAPARPKTNPLALTSMITGIAGVTIGFCLWFFPVLPILAIVFGHIGLSQIRRQGTSGRGMAIAGLVTGYIGLALALILLLLIIVGSISSPTPTF